MRLLPPTGVPRALALDIDGTLTDDDRLLDPEVLPRLRRLEAAGIPVLLATGNVRPIAWGLARFLGVTGPVVCENGGLIWDRPSQRLHRIADGSEARAAAEWLAERIPGLDPHGIATNAWRETEWCLHPDEPLDRIEALIASSPWSNLRVVRTGFAIHLTDPAIDKGAGLRVAASWMGCEVEEMWAMGDASNDVPMFASVGWSVAVGGAYPPAVAAADVVAEQRHGQAVCAMVDQLLERVGTA